MRTPGQARDVTMRQAENLIRLRDDPKTSGILPRPFGLRVAQDMPVREYMLDKDCRRNPDRRVRRKRPAKQQCSPKGFCERAQSRHGPPAANTAAAACRKE